MQYLNSKESVVTKKRLKVIKIQLWDKNKKVNKPSSDIFYESTLHNMRIKSSESLCEEKNPHIPNPTTLFSIYDTKYNSFMTFVFLCIACLVDTSHFS